jgi:hypothetical protein
MAKLPALISALDLTSQRERSTIEHIARVIREAGFIPTTKRGPGASDMGGREATNLLLAVAASDLPKDAPLTVDSLRNMKAAWKIYPDDGLPDVVAGVHEAKNFGEAIEALIANAAKIAAFGRDYVIEKNDQGEIDFIKLPPEIVTVDEMYQMYIEIDSLPFGAEIIFPYFKNGIAVQKKWGFSSGILELNSKSQEGSPFDPFRYGRIKTVRRIGLVPIFKLWAALNGLPHANGPTELSL